MNIGQNLEGVVTTTTNAWLELFVEDEEIWGHSEGGPSKEMREGDGDGELILWKCLPYLGFKLIIFCCGFTNHYNPISCSIEESRDLQAI